VDPQLERSTVRIKTVHGDILIKLFPQKAPLSVERIRLLTDKGFYNGLIFHKVIPNFIIQTGDPDGSGEGGSGQGLKGEKNNLLHTLGTLSMVRQESDINSADSQFFICIGECEKLDGRYTIFGHIVAGIEIAKKIQLNDKIIFMTLE